MVVLFGRLSSVFPCPRLEKAVNEKEVIVSIDEVLKDTEIC